MAEQAGLLGIAGIHEKAILMHSGSSLRNRLAEEDLGYLQALPYSRELTFAGKTVCVVHGAPWDDHGEIRCTYVYEHDSQAIRRLGETAADVVLMGHTHMAMASTQGRVLALNPGSCGEGRDRERRLSYAQLDFSRGIANVFRIHEGDAPELILSAEIPD